MECVVQRSLRDTRALRIFLKQKKNYFCNPENLRYLFRVIEIDKKRKADDPFNFRQKIKHGQVLFGAELTYLAELMGMHYVLQNYKDRVSRAIVFLAFTTGGVLLGREPINLSGGLLVRVRYAPTATELLRRREMTRRANSGHALAKDASYVLPNTTRVPTAEWITLSPSACRAKS
jgi:hypothetical protein